MLKDTVKANRSFRNFDESYIFTKDKLLGYIELTRYCASSVNIQPLKYRVSYAKEEVEAVLKLTKWAGLLPEKKLPYENMHPTAFIIICQDTDISANMQMFQKDIGIAAQTIMLAAAEDGLGGCMIGSFNTEKLKSLTGMGENIVPQLVLALGKPNETVVITDVENDGSTKYYRDGNDTHYVPKRTLEDILI